MRLSFFFLIASFTITGCGIGIGYVHEKESTYKNIMMYKKKGSVAGVFFAASSNSKPHKYSKSDVLTTWGEPDKKIVLDDKVEAWEYHRTTAFSGPLLWLLLQIPLVIPTGHRDTSIFFDNDALIRTTVQSNGISWAGCGCFDSGCGCGIYENKKRRGYPNL